MPEHGLSQSWFLAWNTSVVYKILTWVIVSVSSSHKNHSLKKDQKPILRQMLLISNATISWTSLSIEFCMFSIASLKKKKTYFWQKLECLTFWFWHRLFVVDQNTCFIKIKPVYFPSSTVARAFVALSPDQHQMELPVASDSLDCILICSELNWRGRTPHSQKATSYLSNQ